MDNAVNVIGHDDEFIGTDVWVKICQIIPYRLQHPAGMVQVHLPGCNMPKQ